MKAFLYSTLAIGLLCGAPPPAEAAPFILSRADWTAASTGTAEVDLAGVSEFDIVSQIDLPFGRSLAFDTDVERLEVPGSWGSWSGGNEPELLYTFASFSITASFLPGPLTGGFGLEVQPDLFGLFPITLTLSDGTTVTQDVDGFGGALFFGWQGAGIDSFTVSCVDCAFAFGRMVIAEADVPAPPPLLLMGTALAVWVVRSLRRHPGARNGSRNGVHRMPRIPTGLE